MPRHIPKLLSTFACVTLTAALAVTPITAQPVGTDNSDAAPAVETQVGEIETQVRSNRQRLQTILEERGVVEDRAAELAAEIDVIKKDRASITAALIASAKAEKKLSEDIIAAQEELAGLTEQEAGLTDSLWERRALLAEVLGALQRMGLNPPPAILVTPEDALSSVRSSILLAAVVPEMRVQTQVLVDNLKELAGLRATISEETARLEQKRAEQAAEQGRLELLVVEKRRLEDERERALVASQSQLTQLAEEAADLEGLITSLSDEVDRIRTEAEQKRLEAEAAARRIEEERIAAVQEAERARLEALQQEEEKRQAALQAAENARLAAIQALEESRRRAQALAEKPQIMTPSAPIASRRGQLSRPVAGTLLTRFGTDDGLGNRAQGETIETLANAIVTAPVDGSVLYAGPFRAYGNLLILDAGDGYHIVLAGMDRIEVAQGQFVVAGEPVGIMGSIRLASVAAAAAEKNNPTLYVEFRKDGRPVDASPWWVAIGGQGRT